MVCPRISDVEQTLQQPYKSCYKLVPSDPPKNFALKAAEKCTASRGSLVSIETTMELNFLRAEIEQLCPSDIDGFENATMVIKGLRRNLNSLGKRFRWVNGRPLLYSYWIKGLPIGGCLNVCDAWNLNLGTWVDVGCGQLIPNGTASLCEWTTIFSEKVLEIPLPAPPDQKSIQRAINRANIGICDYQLTLYGLTGHDKDTSINVVLDCAFLCNISNCVPWSELGNGVVDCLGPEVPLDETLENMESADCEDSLLTEWAPRCVYQKDRLGELIGCRNMRHLHGCEDLVCPVGYIKCPKAYCIPLHYVFNVVIDCSFGEDELIISNITKLGL
ncbi:hypothetical protein RRG08_023997 [Elysia crispata]|uniref:C-type lectin domain-containing protein n=1 Tax=Elysia crispata TaxID=231223 RepID=A0AAE0YMX2_9GAST|nr:hypothetical protein RRG08_023997 [Elysia crispata]